MSRTCRHISETAHTNRHDRYVDRYADDHLQLSVGELQHFRRKLQQHLGRDHFELHDHSRTGWAYDQGEGDREKQRR